MRRHAVWIALLLCISLLTPTYSQNQQYPIITTRNATAIEQVSMMGGDQGRIAVSGDDNWLAIAGLQGVWVYDLDAGDEAARLFDGHTDRVNAVVFHPDNQTIASASDDGTVRFWDVETGEETQLIEVTPNPVISLDFDSSGNFLAVSTRPFIRIFAIETGEEIIALNDKEGGVRRVEFVNNSPLIVGATFDNSLAVWNLDENIYIGEIDTSYNGDVLGLSTSTDGTQLAVALSSGRILLGTISNGDQLVLDYHLSGARDVQFSPDGRLIASVGMDNVALVIDTQNGEVLSRLPLDSFGYSVEFSSDSRFLYVATADGKVTTWDINRQQLINDRELTIPSIRQIAFSPNNRHIATITDEDNIARVFDVNTNQQIAVLSGHEGRIFSIAYRPTANLIVAAGDAGNVYVWSVNNYELVDTLVTDQEHIYSVAFTPDQNVIAVGGEQFISLWNLPDKEEILSFNNGTTAWGLSVSPDGSLIASSGGIWNAFTGEKAEGLVGEFAGVAFSPNSDILATSDRLIPVEPRRIRRPRNGYVGLSNTEVAFSPDGSLIAMAVEENIELIDVETQSIIAILRGHERDVRSITFSPDGRRIVSGGDDATIRQWAVVDTAATSDVTLNNGIEVIVMPDNFNIAPITRDTLTPDNIEQAQSVILRQAISNVVDIDVSPDGSHAVIASLAGVFYLDLNNLNDAPIPLVPTNAEIFTAGLAVDFAQDGTMIAVSHGFARSQEAVGGGVSFWDVTDDTPALIAEHLITGDRGFSIALSNSKELAAIGFDTPVMRVISVETGEQVSSSRGQLFGRVNGLAFIPDDSTIALSDTSGNKAFVETVSGNILAGFNSGIAVPMEWSPNSSRIYSAEQSGFILRDGATAEIIREHAYPAEVTGEILTTDITNGQLLIATENSVWFLDYETGEINETIEGFNSVITTAKVTPDGIRLLGVTNDNHLRVWDIDSGLELINTELGFIDPQATTAVSDRGEFIAIAERGVGIRIFSGITGRFLRSINTTQTDHLNFLPGSNFLATGGSDDVMEFWEAATGDRIALVQTGDNIITTFSDNGDYMITQTDTLTFNVHNTHNGNLVFEDLRAHIGRTQAIAIQDDLMATAGNDGIIKLWDLDDREQEVFWYAHEENIHGLAFAPTETLLASISGRDIDVYDYRPFSNVNQRFTFNIPAYASYNGIYFSNDSDLLFVHVDDILHIWSMNNGNKFAEISWLNGTSIITRDGEELVAVNSEGSIYKFALQELEE